MSEVVCPACGTPNPAGNRFCGSCGQAMEQACPACGNANPLGNRFCGACGTAFDAAPVPARVELEERKVVSMLFADLTASTELAGRLDPEDLRGVLRPFYDAMAEEIERFGGTVEKFIGDAVVAAFGAPVAHEDDPERAIRCALAMHGRLRELNADLAERAGGDLAMRIGINTGDVIAHSIEEGIVTGEAVNIAARLQSLAEPGRVVVGERTFRQAGHAFAFTDLGEVTVKGVDRPLHVFTVDRELGTSPGTSGRLRTPFVGREGEIDLLRLLFERTVRERRPSLATVVGPPGIGKSRLTQEVAELLASRGARVVRGRCLPYGEGLTYWPLAEILRADAGILDSDPAEVVLAKARERLEPRFAAAEAMGTTAVLLSSIGVEQPSDPLAGTERDAARRLIARAWQRYLESLASDGPLVALLEDLHWADPGLLELVEWVAGRAVGPAFLLGMTRPDLLERRPDWGGGLTNATTITLSPLSAADGTQLIERLLDGPAPAEIVRAILDRSEGNPFFAGELLRMIVEDGTIERRDGRWVLVRDLPSSLPDTVQGVIASRLDRLPAADKRAIQDASVIGRTFWADGVERLGTVDAQAVIGSLVAKGLVLERGGTSIEGQREFAFAHVLIRDVAYGSIPRARRAQAHGIVGAWMEEGTSGRAEEFAEILAYHFSEAGDVGRTARYSLAAGQRLLRLFAAEDAITWFDRALETTGDPEVLAQVALARGTAREQLGRFDEAREDYEAVVQGADVLGDASTAARAFAASTHTLLLLDRYDEGQARLPEALARARSSGLTDVEGRMLYTAGGIRFGRGEFPEAISLHDQALRVATAAGNVEGQALAHHGLCESYFFQGPLPSGLVHGQEADRLFRELGQRHMVAHNAYMVAWLLGFLGRPDDALMTVEESIETSHEIGSAREEGFALFDRSELHLAAGRLDAALADAERGTSIFVELGLSRGELVGRNILCEVLAEVWELPRLTEEARRALEISEALGGTFQRVLALAYAAWGSRVQGRTMDADRFVASARRLDGAFLDLAWGGRIETLMWEWAGDAAALREVGARIEEHILPTNAFWGAWGPYANALAASLEGRHEEALEGARSALGSAERVGDRRLAWRAARVAGRALGGLDRTEEAETYRRQAAETVFGIAEAASGSLREGFVRRPDVAELLG